MTIETSIDFFKKQELIDENHLMSTIKGEERLALASAALHGYFAQLSSNINNHIKVIIGGWHRGYTAKAVADYLIDVNQGRLRDADYEIEDVGLLLTSMFVKMGYGREASNWGDQYGYRPALEERTADPLAVQVAINDRALENSKVGRYECATFGQYQNNAGALRNSEELEPVDKFRTEVQVALLNRREQFFVTTEFDNGDDHA